MLANPDVWNSEDENEEINKQMNEETRKDIRERRMKSWKGGRESMEPDGYRDPGKQTDRHEDYRESEWVILIVFRVDPPASPSSNSKLLLMTTDVRLKVYVRTYLWVYLCMHVHRREIKRWINYVCVCVCMLSMHVCNNSIMLVFIINSNWRTEVWLQATVWMGDHKCGRSYLYGSYTRRPSAILFILPGVNIVAQVLTVHTQGHNRLVKRKAESTIWEELNPVHADLLQLFVLECYHSPKSKPSIFSKN